MWRPPDWLAPIVGLADYPNGNHETACLHIERICEREGVDLADIASAFAAVYPEIQKRYRWKNPILAMVQTLPRQIRRIKEQAISVGEEYQTTGKYSHVADRNMARLLQETREEEEGIQGEFKI